MSGNERKKEERKKKKVELSRAPIVRQSIVPTSDKKSKVVIFTKSKYKIYDDQNKQSELSKYLGGVKSQRVDEQKSQLALTQSRISQPGTSHGGYDWMKTITFMPKRESLAEYKILRNKHFQDVVMDYFRRPSSLPVRSKWSRAIRKLE